MAEFTPGLIQGGEALSRDRYRQAQIDEAMKMLAMREQIFQQEQQARQKAQQMHQGAMQLPPMMSPQQPPVQAMPPGQPSMPQPPQGPPPGAAFGPPGGQPNPILGQQPPMPMLSGGGGPPPTQGPPPGWQVGGTATPKLGGPDMPQGQPGVMPKQLIDPLDQVQKAIARGVTGDQLQTWYEMNKPMWDASNKARMEESELQVRVEQAKERAARAAKEKWELEHPKPTAAQQDALFVTGGDVPSAQKLMGLALERKGIPPGGGGEQFGFSPDAVELGARMYLQTGQLPAMGMGKDAVRVRGQIMQRAAELQKEGGGDLGDVASNVAGFKADTSSLRQLTQRSNAIEASAKKIDKDMKTLDKYLESGTAGSVTLVNRPLNVLRTEFSDPKLNELAVAAKIVGTEYERMITGGLLSVAQLHEGAREDADKLLNLNMTPEQMRATIKIMKQEIQNQRSSWKDQIEEVKKGMRGGSSGETPAVGTKKITNDAEYNALPSGTEFIAPDGSHRKKP